jgi:carboxypeptidase family protein
MKILRFRALMFVLGAFFLLPFFAGRMRAQTSSATLRGQVTDPSGAAVVHATVVANSAAGETKGAEVSQDGTYEIKGLAPGKYTVSAVAKGFAPYEQREVEIVAGQVRKLDIALKIEQQVQKVEVTGEATKVEVNPQNNASSLVIKGKDLEALSDDPDELQSELEALAGPAAGPNGGQIYIDGFTGGQLPPKSAIREIRVNQNPFSAEYDRLGYGRIEILTKPGLDQYHGQFFANGNASSFNSRNPFATQIPGYHSEFLDGNIGGPLVSKKASFFFDGEHRKIQDNSVVSAYVLGPNFKPVPYSQAVSNPRSRTELSPRVDYQLSTNNTLTVRYQFFRNNETDNGIGQLALPSQAYNSLSTEHTLQVSDSQVLSARAVNETRFRYLREHTDQTSQNLQPTVSVLGAFVGGGNSLGMALETDNRYELQNYTSMSLGKHLVRFGGRLRDLDERNESTRSFNGVYTFSSLMAYEITEQGLQQGWSPAKIRAAGGGPNQFSIVTGNPLAHVNLIDLGLYGEDDWRIRPNMALSLGLRYETQNDIHDHADVAPRLGFAWGIGGGKNRSPKTVLRAGFGIFYDRFTDNLVLQAERLNGLNEEQFVVGAPDFFPAVPPPSVLTSLKTLPSIYRIDPNLRAPYTIQEGVGLERQLSRYATASVTYLNSHGVHQLLSRNINAPLPGTYDPSDPASGVRPFGDVGNIFQYESDGLFNQNQLITNLRIQKGNRLSLFGVYTLNFANSNTAGASSFVMNPYDLSEDYGRAAFDVRNRMFVGGSLALPRGFRINPFIVAASGAPFNIMLGQDWYGTSIFNARPAFATDLSRPNVVVTPFGAFDTRPIPGEVIIPPNYGNGPGLFTLNLRLSKTFGFGEKIDRGESSGGRGGYRGGHGGGLGGRGLSSGGGGFGWGSSTNRRYNLTFGVAARNIFNNVNLATPIGTLDSPLFGHSNALAGGPFSSSAANRRIDFQAIFSF